MKIAFLAKDKPICRLAYDWCKERYKDIQVVALVAPPEFNCSAITQEKLVERISGINKIDLDLVVSFLYWKKIKEPLISYPKLGSINFHPAPLPEYKGVAPYTKGIIDGVDQWGVTAHYIDAEIDTGDIIKKHPVDISNKDTSKSLAARSNCQLFQLFVDVMNSFMAGNQPRGTKQEDNGSYFSKKDFEKLREIKKTDSRQLIERKIRAFWCPPHEGAYVIVNGVRIHAYPDGAL